MMEKESILVLHHTYFQAQFLRHARFTFADPLRMFLENRKHLLLMRDAFSLEDSAPGLIDLPLRVPYVMLYSIVGYCRYPVRFRQNLKGCLCFFKILFRRLGVLPEILSSSVDEKKRILR